MKTIETLYSAPMAGVSDKPFRMMVRRFSGNVLFTEMVAANALKRKHPVTVKMMQIADEKNLIVQLVGNDLDALLYGAQMAENMGAIGVDINMGCPVKKLIANGSGALLMTVPDAAAKIVETVAGQINIPVSVKTRLGYDEKHKNVIAFSKILESAGAAFITVHGRTREMLYRGASDWEMIARVKENLNIPVIANGDIIDRKSALKALKITGADGLMVGRGLLGKPWMLHTIGTGQTLSPDLGELAAQHLDLLIGYYGMPGLYVFRKHLAWYAAGKKKLADFLRNVYAESDIKKIKTMVENYMKENARV
ncbi:MAG: tRNA dihydrouridine synthase DusB [Lactobacillales bacterium]|jgi:tRNA-dihydrouridine synthase B|nr:tRNA dihydrouridine synthase DusB [Lactobacillales bacterium]